MFEVGVYQDPISKNVGDGEVVPWSEFIEREEGAEDGDNGKGNNTTI